MRKKRRERLKDNQKSNSIVFRCERKRLRESVEMRERMREGNRKRRRKRKRGEET